MNPHERGFLKKNVSWPETPALKWIRVEKSSRKHLAKQKRLLLRLPEKPPVIRSSATDEQISLDRQFQRHPIKHRQGVMMMVQKLRSHHQVPLPQHLGGSFKKGVGLSRQRRGIPRPR